MAGTALKIDDDYVLDMGTTLSDNETELQSGVDKYLEIMKKIRKMPLRKGNRTGIGYIYYLCWGIKKCDHRTWCECK